MDEWRGWLRSHFPVTVPSEEGKLCVGPFPGLQRGSWQAESAVPSCSLGRGNMVQGIPEASGHMAYDLGEGAESHFCAEDDAHGGFSKTKKDMISHIY